MNALRDAFSQLSVPLNLTAPYQRLPESDAWLKGKFLKKPLGIVETLSLR
uniref:Uncharacterized protein n=1 Tax=Arundo donax TaxID=35708 RepID=A0A0A9B9Z1_ARUDO